MYVLQKCSIQKSVAYILWNHLGANNNIKLKFRHKLIGGISIVNKHQYYVFIYFKYE